MQGGHLPLAAGSLLHTSPGDFAFGQMELTFVALFRKANHTQNLSFQGEQKEMPRASEGNRSIRSPGTATGTLRTASDLSVVLRGTAEPQKSQLLASLDPGSHKGNLSFCLF